MNEGKKTGIFWITAVVATAMAAVVSLPQSTETTTDQLAGTMLFDGFKEPADATSMRIVTFDDEQGKLESFEVRKDRGTGLWTIPSREGYPADAVEQMRDAANSLVGIKILDVQTTNAEDHDDLGVIEPKIETLEVGDEGVGRLVTFKDEKKGTLASLIIGQPVKDDETKRYVRVPNENPVYVVKFDESSLTTKFTDWIEDDLLQMSSIDIKHVEIKDYTASLGREEFLLARNFTASLEQTGTDWELGELVEFDAKDALAEPKKVEPKDGEELNTEKLNAMKNALDDLKIVGVFRKPEGLSASLKASEVLLNNQNAILSLNRRGFYPVQRGANTETEILSANGEMSLSLQEGVQYILRFGNIADMTADQEKAGQSSSDDAGVNRYLFVTTQVNDSMFPAPDLSPIPKTLEELETLLNPKPPKTAPEGIETKGEPSSSKPETEPMKEAESVKESESAVAKEPEMKNPESDQPSQEEKPADETKTEKDPLKEKADSKKSAEEAAKEKAKPNDKAGASDEVKAEKPVEPEASNEPANQGETEGSGEGEATGTGQAQEETEKGESDAAKGVNEGDPEIKATPDKKTMPEEAAKSQESSNEDADAASKDEQRSKDEELSEDEKLERLEAEQEKITKANQRKIDSRNDRMKAAQERVDELNERFADWYYVIPESTYSQLKITRDDLFKSEADAGNTPAANPLPGGPQLNLPGFLPNVK